MGSVISTEKCPQCGGMYTRDYYYRTGEEYCHCARCGRHEERFIVRDENRNPVLDANGQCKAEHNLLEGFGSVRIAFKSGVAQISSLTQPVDQEVKDWYLKVIEDPEVEKEDCYLSSWDPEKKDVVMIYGKMPETYDEFEERIAEEEETTDE